MAYGVVAIWHLVLFLQGGLSELIARLVPLVLVGVALSLPGRAWNVAGFAAVHLLWQLWCWRGLLGVFKLFSPDVSMTIVGLAAAEFLATAAYVGSTSGLIFATLSLRTRNSLDKNARGIANAGAWLAFNAAFLIALEAWLFHHSDRLRFAGLVAQYVALVAIGSMAMGLERLWDRRRKSWLSGIHTGRVEGWRVDALDGSNHHDGLPFFRDRDRDRCDGALGRVLEGRPYREEIRYVALVPTPTGAD